MASNFGKIGYPLVISPAFAVANVKIRGAIIAFINAEVISLGVFPVYDLAKRILKETKHIWLCVYLYLITPSLTYSMTYMSEVLSIPLSLYLLFELFVFEEKESSKKMDMRTRKFFSLATYLILVTAVVVSAMIYVVEDFPSVTPRAHLRYVEFLFVPVVLVFLQILEMQNEDESKRMNFAIVLVWAVTLLAIFKGFSGQTIDQTMLFYWQLIADEGKNFSATRVRLCSAIIIVVVATLMVSCHRNKNLFEKIFLTGQIFLCLGNNVLSVYVQYKTHTHTPQQVEEVEQILNFVREHKTDEFLVMKSDEYNEMIDTTLIDCDNVWTGLEIGPTQIEEQRVTPAGFQYIIVSNQEKNLSRLGERIAVYPSLGCAIYRLESSKLYNK